VDPTILKEFGPWVAVVGVLLWWIWQDRRRNDERYDEIVKHVRKMEEDRTGILIELNHRSINAMRDVTNVLRELLEGLGKRPCLQRSHKTPPPGSDPPDDESGNIPLPSVVKKPDTSPLVKTPPRGVDAIRASTAALIVILSLVACSGCTKSETREAVATDKRDRITLNGTITVPTADGAKPVPVALTLDRQGTEDSRKETETRSGIDGQALGQQISTAIVSAMAAASGGGPSPLAMLGAAGSALTVATTGWLALKKHEQVRNSRRGKNDPPA
jgi:hypothetical protein